MTHSCGDLDCGAAGHPCGADEQRLSALLADIVALSNAGSFHSASRRFADLRLTLEQEMNDLEHEALPVLALRGSHGAVRKLHEAHFAIHGALNQLGEALSQSEAGRVESTIQRLNTSLRVHRLTERQELARLGALRRR